MTDYSKASERDLLDEVASAEREIASGQKRLAEARQRLIAYKTRNNGGGHTVAHESQESKS